MHLQGVDHPTQAPPTAATMATAGAAQPEQLPPGAAAAVSAPAAPSEPLPDAAGAKAGVTVWVNTQTINALWSMNQTRNSWIGVANVGWKKLADNSDSASMALTMLSAHAREKQSPVNYREEADGKIHEMYVW